MNCKVLRQSALTLALTAAMVPAIAAASDSRALAAAQIATPESIRLQANEPTLLMFRAGSYDPLDQRLDLSGSSSAEVLSRRYAIVQLHSDRLAEGRRDLQAQGVDVVGYVPNNAYLVRLNGNRLDTIKASPAVRAAEFQPAGLKIDPRLWKSQRAFLLQQPVQGSAPTDPLLDIIELHGFRGERVAEIEGAVHKLAPDATILRSGNTSSGAPLVRVAIDRTGLDRVLRVASSIDAVAFVEPWIPTLLHNAGSVGAIQGNSLSTCGGAASVCGPTPLWSQGILGSQQIIAVFDSGTTPWSAYFTTLDQGAGPLMEITFSDDPAPVPPNIGNIFPNRKIVAYWLQPDGPTNYDYYSQHGTHTSATVLGDLAGSFNGTNYLAATPTDAHHELADGMAPNAQLLVQDGGGIDQNAIYIADLAATLQQAYAGGARIHSNSWGADTAGNYTSLDADADNVVWREEDMLMVVSAGNNGGAGPSQTGSPSNAKNVLSVGAVGHAGSTDVPWWSSRGPAADGRQKPDIAAPGDRIWSASASLFSAVPMYTAPATLSGTSMAAPAISGNAALVRQYFTDGFYPRGLRTPSDAYNPSGMIMKAVLLNGTNPLGAPDWPNADTGWGRAWLDGNLWFKSTTTGGDDSRRLRLFERTHADGMQTGEVHEYTLQSVGSDAELRATLVWFDPSATYGVAQALVNNLDLEVVAPDGSVYKGNAFNAGVSVSGGSADAIDTVEQVRLPAPVGGSYILRVKAHSVPGNGYVDTDRQGYALVVSGAFGLSDAEPAPAPMSAFIQRNDTDGIAVGFSAPASQSFQLYRAHGECASVAAGDFRLVAHGAESPLIDRHSQGGERYAYKLRAIANDVEGQLSECIDAISADECTLRPTIAPASLSGNGWNDMCRTDLHWDAGVPTCSDASGAVTYSLERSTDALMENSELIASEISTTSFSDTSVSSGVAYYYRLRATDSLGNVSEASEIAATMTASTLGPDPDPFEDNADGAAWLVMEPDWSISSNASADGNYSYHTGGQAAYSPDLSCSSIETPALTLTANAVLNFSAQYNLEYRWDGVVTEISNDDGATWTDLPPEGGYPTTLGTGQIPPINACGFWDGKGVFSGVSTSIADAAPGNDTAVAVFKPFSIDLSSFAGQSVKIRWRYSSDPATSYSGFFLDKVRIGDSRILFRNDFDSSPYMCQ